MNFRTRVLIIGSVFAFNAERTSAQSTVSIAEFYRPHITSTSRNFYTYSFQKRKYSGVRESGPLSSGDRNKLKSFVKVRSGQFLDPKHEESLSDTQGLYLATDPVVSRGWGSKDYLLFRLKISSHVRMLDLDAASSKSEFPEKWKLKLKSAGCSITDPEEFIRQSTRSPACRKIALATLKDLKIDLIKYGWLSEEFEGCSPRNESTAFIVLNPGIFKEEDVSMFASQTPVLPTQKKEQAMIAAIYRLAKNTNHFDAKEVAARRLWPELANEVSDSEAKKWIQQNLLGCDPGVTNENLPIHGDH